jgi:hypothetical protein
MSLTFGYSLDMSWTFGESPDIVPTLIRTFGDSLEIVIAQTLFWTCPGHVLDMSRTFIPLLKE